MKKSIDKKLVRFYLWVGLGSFFLGLIHTHTQYPGKFLFLVLNNIWALIYVITLNFILFEYATPFVLRKRKNIISNIFLAILLLCFFLILYSFGSYGWRLLGISLHIYTALITFPTLDEAYQNQME